MTLTQEKSGNVCTKPYENSEKWVTEWIRCRLNFKYFLQNYVKINDPDRGIIPFEPWPHLLYLIRCFLTHKEIVILKARQLGISWLVAAYALWKSQFYASTQVLLLSQGEKEATKLLDKCRFIYNQLPEYLKLEVRKDQNELMSFPDAHSEIVALPSTVKAGHGYHSSVVIRDELEHHPEAERNFAAVGPSVDAGGQMIDLSTVDKTRADTHFKLRYIGAVSGKNGAFPIFLPWWVRPVREQGLTLKDWFDRIKRKYAPWQVEQEYPETERQALGVLSTRMWFDLVATAEMRLDVLPPVDHDISRKHSGLVKVYKHPVAGRRYCLATDPSSGKEDPHAIIVMDWQTGEEVAESHGRIPAEQVAEIHDDLTRLYNNAYNTFERSGYSGGLFETRLKELRTPNQATSIKGDGTQKAGEFGFWMSHKLRGTILRELEEAVRKHSVRVHNDEAISEFESFIQLEGGEPGPTGGRHDDYVIAWAIVWYIRRFMPMPIMNMKAFPLKETW